MTTLECVEVDELLGGYGLTALDPGDQAAVDRHLTRCSSHQGSIQELTDAADRLLLAVPERQPRPALRDRIFAAIRAQELSPSAALGWSKERLAVGSHACLFHSDDRGLKETMAFLRAGLDEPDQFGAVVADESRFASLKSWLQEGYAGSVTDAIDRGKLAMVAITPTSEALLEAIGARLDQAMAGGYRIIRLLGLIGWDQPAWPDTASIIEFERRINDVVRGYPAVVVCTYDVRRLGGLSLMEGGLRNHPIAIIGDRIIRDNPFYLAA